MRNLIFLYVVILSIFIKTLNSLDVSFIPNDENAPLPLSTKYRQALSKLCDILESNAELPKELVMKKKVISKMCKKLRLDESKFGGDSGFKAERLGRKVLIAFITCGTGYFAWNNRMEIHQFLRTSYQTIFKKSKKGRILSDDSKDYSNHGGNNNNIEVVATPDMDKIVEAREARLKRFAEISSGSSVNPHE